MARTKQTRNQLSSKQGNSEVTLEEKHELFTKCISDRLRTLGLCSTDDEYTSTSGAIAASVPIDSSPTEEELDNVVQELLEYFEDVPKVDAKALVYAAASDAYGSDVARITGTANKDGADDGSSSSEEKEEVDSNFEVDEIDDDGEYIGEGECELCEREVKLTRHHVIPRTTWPRMKKRIWNAAATIEAYQSISYQIKAASGKEQQDLEEKQRVLEEKLEKIFGPDFDFSGLPSTITHDTVRAYLNRVAKLCRQCHSAIHRIYTETELATRFNTMERLLECDEVMKFGKWASKQRPGKYAV